MPVVVLGAVAAAGYEPGTDVMLARDAAASEFYKDGKYELAGEGRSLDAAGMVAYYGIVAAMRIGEISFVTPFRYARLLFAMVVGITIFGERPDLLTYVGATIIVASGIYTVWRERKVKEQA